MSLHKLSAGSGYDYLTRQVAVQDITEKGHTGLASYYTERGETPGVWVGSGCASIDPNLPDSVVTQEQMQALFGAGLNPIGPVLVRELGPDAPEELKDAARRLGTPFRINGAIDEFRIEVARRIGDLNMSRGLHRDAPVSIDDRARIRTDVARETFVREFGRPPADARELAGTIARHSRPVASAVAGFDLTFSPPKSVSTLWALADPTTSARIELAHQKAVKHALDFIESELLYSREGTRGVRQVDVTGLVAASFTHRDSRAGDPDLHTHVAVANKVRTAASGKWLSIDGRVLYRGAVAASEQYNTALIKLLECEGFRFVDRPSTDARKRPVRELAGISAELNERWSSRRTDIEHRRASLVTEFQRNHHRPPSVIEAVKLAQQATLETREAKHEPRSLAQQRTLWRAQAIETLGGEGPLRRMLDNVVSATRPELAHADAAWFHDAADRIVRILSNRSATWQNAHMRAEALRQLRHTDVPIERLDAAVNLLVAAVADRSLPLARPDMGITEPVPLRRRDGSSVYTVAGADLYTSAEVVQAERQLVDLAGRTGGRRVGGERVTAALDASSEAGRPLNPGQTELVTAMATSSAFLQLAIAPAGAGKTTAMQTLAAAWTAGGGSVIGLAPSAAAATQLRDQTGTITETLAKLAWHIEHGNPPRWARNIGQQTLIVIDEAGMADTLSLSRVCAWAVDRGASVRLIGDDQQLAAIGAGGTLRDIQATHGAVRLNELMRFADSAESAASLALRDGEAAALGFYLDNQRVHVGDLTTMTDRAFDAWRCDTVNHLDSIMLAPTRNLVRELNQRARNYRLTGLPNGTEAGHEVRLADGCEASVGDTVITRTNDRQLRVSRTDWVKNGDRWVVRRVTRGGDLVVQHNQTGRQVTLPAGYVQASVELGYATTVHSAQGVSADTMHGLATGNETRQQFYTMMTRGRQENHVWLEVIGDGDDASLIRPEGVSPLTPTDILAKILARDGSQVSATTLLRDQTDPVLLLGDATQQYLDGLQVAAEHHLGNDYVTGLDANAEQLLPGISDAPAWPTLRAHLLLLGAQDINPLDRVRDAIDLREIASAYDVAAVISWRMDDSGLRNTTPGPLPWIPGIPEALADQPTFGAWLHQRSDLVAHLANQVREQAVTTGSDPAWVPAGVRRPSDQVIADVEVWRAAMQIEATDRRPTGPIQLSRAAVDWQHHLNQQIRQGTAPALAEWGEALSQVSPAITDDDFLPQLADRLAGLARTGHDAATLLHEAAAAAPLPDDHAAAALWWRIQRHIPATDEDATPTAWTDRLAVFIGETNAHQLTASRFWPSLRQQIDEALERGWQPEQLLLHPISAAHEDDPWLALLARVSTLTEGPSMPDLEGPQQMPPDDLYDGWEPPDPRTQQVPAPNGQEEYDRLNPENLNDVESELAMAALLRSASVGVFEPTDAEIARQMDRADAWRTCPATRERLVHINQLTQDFYAGKLPGSWAQTYLMERFGADLTGHPLVQPGHAPAGWTSLVHHLRRLGVSDTEMIAGGVARTASTGRLIDQFRDRIVFPITNDEGEILGFVGRRNPDSPDDGSAGPKYLNTGETPLFHKGDQFYGTPRPGTIPVIVEGPMDAIAVTLSGGARYTGLAPLGTSLTDQQAALLHGHSDVVIATDADLAGHLAAERDYWQLTPHGIDPRRAVFPEGTDPADLLTSRGPSQVAATLDRAEPMAHTMIDERLAILTEWEAIDQAAQIIAARPPNSWDADSQQISERLSVPFSTVREALARHARVWNTDPRVAAAQTLFNTASVRRRLEAANRNNRWAEAANNADPRLTSQPDWPALARTIQQIHEAGYDAEKAVSLLARPNQASTRPAADLRARLVSNLHLAEQCVERTGPLIDEHHPRPRAASRHRQPKPIVPTR